MPDSSVRVVCRFRPINAREREEGDVEGAAQLEFPDSCTVTVKQSKVPPQIFSFDRVFHDTAVTQREVYEFAAKETVDDVIQGYNGTIFAYGQTGAGKSFSMFGADVLSKELKGIIPRACEHIFKYIANDQTGCEFTIKCSFLEIYKEIVRDLLDPERVNLKVRETPTRGVWVDSLSEQFVTSVDDVIELLRLGEKHRATSATKMNQVSSRSHSLFILTLQQRSPDGSMKEGRLNLADLAGSEKVGKTGATGDTLEEAKKINQSLSALGNCINALTKAKKSHIPYRDSKLTHILRESLGGNSKTTLLIACSPHSFNVEETISTLKFGQRAKTIKTSARINQTRSVAELEAIIAKLTRELDFWRAYSTLLEKEVTKFDKSFDFESLRKQVAASLRQRVEQEEQAEQLASAESDLTASPDNSFTSPPSTPRKSDNSIDDSINEEESTPEKALLPPTPFSPMGVQDPRGVAEMQVKMQAMKDELSIKISDLEEDLRLARAEHEEKLVLEAKLQEVQAALEKERAENQMRLQAVEYEMKKLQSSADEKAADAEKAASDLHALKEQLAALKTSKDAIEAERNKFFGVLMQAKTDVLRAREEASKSAVLEDKLVKLAERFHAQEERRQELESIALRAQSNVETLQVQLQSKSDENEILEHEVARLRQKAATLEQIAESVKEDMHKKLMEKSSQASASAADAQAAAESARQNQRQSEESAKLALELADSKRLNIQLQSEGAIKDVKVRELQGQLEEMKKSLQQSQKTLETERATSTQLDRKMQELASQMHAQQLTKESIDAELNESKRIVSTLQAQVTATQFELDRNQRDALALQQRTQKQLDQANQRVAELESTRDKLKTQNEGLETSLDEAKAAIAHLQSVIAQQQQQLQLHQAQASASSFLSSSALSSSPDEYSSEEHHLERRGTSNIRKPITKAAAVRKSSGPTAASPQRPVTQASPPVSRIAPSSPTKTVPTSNNAPAKQPSTPAAVSMQSPVASPIAHSSSSPSIVVQTKKERGFFSSLLGGGSSGPTKRYVSEVCSKQGHLFTHVGVFDTWKSLHFMLWNTELYGWKSSSESDRKADVTITVVGCTGITALEPAKTNEGPYRFVISYPAGKSATLGAASQAEVTAWIEAIVNAVRQAGGTIPGYGTPSAPTAPSAAADAAAAPQSASSPAVPIRSKSDRNLETSSDTSEFVLIEEDPLSAQQASAEDDS